MRKIAAIFLMLVLLFNTGGYRLAISLLQKQSDHRLEARIDTDNYDESQLVEIRVPLNMPYQERFTEFERQYGEINIDGKAYTYVKRKIDGDVVIFKCIANKDRQALGNIQDNLAKANSSNDQNSNDHSNQLSFAKNFWSEYEPLINYSTSLQPSSTLSTIHNSYSASLIQRALLVPHQPPELA